MMSQINVVPYIDVTLVLLIIFMITAPLLTRGVQVELPKAQAKALENAEQNEPLVLTVKASGDLYLSVGAHPDQPIQPNMVVAMTKIVLQRSPKKKVLVRGDGNAPYEDVVRGMTLLQAGGAEHVGLITKNPDKPLVEQQSSQ